MKRVKVWVSRALFDVDCLHFRFDPRHWREAGK